MCEKQFTKQGEQDKWTWFNFVAFTKTADYLRDLKEGQHISVICEYVPNEYEGKIYPQFVVRSASYDRPKREQGGGYQSNGNQGKQNDFIEDDIPF
jgi:hypothetical protein